MTDGTRPVAVLGCLTLDAADAGELARFYVEALGATTPEHQPEPETGLIVVLDPAGHPFCLFEHPAR